jgi:hypothetical protein
MAVQQLQDIEQTCLRSNQVGPSAWPDDSEIFSEGHVQELLRQAGPWTCCTGCFKQLVQAVMGRFIDTSTLYLSNIRSDFFEIHCSGSIHPKMGQLH